MTYSERNALFAKELEQDNEMEIDDFDVDDYVQITNILSFETSMQQNNLTTRIIAYYYYYLCGILYVFIKSEVLSNRGE